MDDDRPGSLDPTFRPDVTAGYFSDYIGVLGLQPDGCLVAGGSFQTTGPVCHTNLVRFFPDGRIDASFVAPGDYDFTPTAIVVEPDGGVLAGDPNEFMRLLPTGSIDNAFVPLHLGARLIVRQLDGKILHLSSDGRVYRLHSNGLLDDTFTPIHAGAYVSALALETNGSILVGGDFGVARYSDNGALLGNLFAGFTVDFPYITSLLPQASGKVIVGGNFTLSSSDVRSLTRLSADGSLDPTFVATNSLLATELHVLEQSDGKLILLGNFDQVSGID
jgi:uncharacterized delta-60 repeat protein